MRDKEKHLWPLYQWEVGMKDHQGSAMLSLKGSLAHPCRQLDSPVWASGRRSWLERNIWVMSTYGQNLKQERRSDGKIRTGEQALWAGAGQRTFSGEGVLAKA